MLQLQGEEEELEVDLQEDGHQVVVPKLQEEEEVLLKQILISCQVLEVTQYNLFL